MVLGRRAALLVIVMAVGAIGFVGSVPAFAGDRLAPQANDGNPTFEHHASMAAYVGASLSSNQLTSSSLSACNSSWNIVPSPSLGATSAFGAVAALSATDIWTVGCSIGGTSVAQTLSAHWNGMSWAIVPTPNGGAGSNVLNNVAAIATGDVWAVGYSRPDNTSAASTLAEHWNGSSWSIVASPNINPGTV